MSAESARRADTHAFLTRVDVALEQDQLTRALRLILSNFSKFPDASPLRERVALALAHRGRKKEAVAIYELVARHYANSGHPTRCLASIKQMTALQPDMTMLLDHFSALYSVRSPYLDAEADPSSPSLPTEPLDLSAKEPQLPEDDLLDLAVERAQQKRGLASQPKQLPALPLLSTLPTETLRRVLDEIDYEIFPETQPVLAEGEVSTDLLWTVDDTLLVRHDDEYARVPSGALLGLGGFGRPASKNEHTVTSTPGAEVLRLSKSSIEAISGQHADFPNRLATLRRFALTERMIATHPFFAELDPPTRVDLVERFIGLHVRKGEPLIRQEAGSPGLFIILEGRVDIVRKDDDWEITIATLGAGEVFGEIGLVSSKPAVAGCVAATDGVMLFLERAEFDAAAANHPALARYAVRLAEERLADVDSTLSADDLSEIE
jgi:hypothetical protein